MNTTEIFLVAMGIVFTVPYLIWRLANTGYYAPLVVVQIVTGIAWWAVMGTMLTTPMVTPLLEKMKDVLNRSK